MLSYHFDLFLLLRYKDGMLFEESNLDKVSSLTEYDPVSSRVNSYLSIHNLQTSDKADYQCAYVSLLDNQLKKSDTIALHLLGELTENVRSSQNIVSKLNS